MPLHELVANPTALLVLLGTWAVRTLALALCAGLGLSAFRVKSTAPRLFTWTAVLYIAFAIPVLGSLLPSFAIPLPARLRTADATVSPVVYRAPEILQLAAEGHATARVENGSVASIDAVAQPANTLLPRPMLWGPIAAALYLAGTAFLLARLGVGLALSRRLLRLAEPIRDPRLVCRDLGSRARVCESKQVSVPVTIGVIRSVILLPSDWRNWEDEKLDAILAHEMSHVARGDASTQLLALVHRALFWFSPLSWWLSRHLSNLAEQASDEAALSRGADRDKYAKTLLGFFAALQSAPQRIRWQGVSMAHAGQTEKRLERILAWKGTFNMRLKKSAIILIVVFAAPVVFLAASAKPSAGRSIVQSPAGQAPAPSSVPDPQGAPTTTPNVQGIPTPGPAAPSLPAAPAQGVYNSGPPPLAPVSPVAPVAPTAPVPSWASQDSDRGFSYTYGFDDEDRFVIVSGKSDSFTMSGTSQDAHHVEKLRKQIPGDFIWFQRDEKSYIIRDQATIDRARKLWAPQQELGKKQEELGKQQEELGKQQEVLGKKMEQVRVNVPDMTAELDRLKAKLQKLGPSATMEQVGDLQSEIGELQSKIGEIQSQAGEQQGKLGELQGELGEKQGKLGEQQGELGRQQGELARKAAIQMKQILDEALKNGTAKPELQVPDSSTL